MKILRNLLITTLFCSLMLSCIRERNHIGNTPESEPTPGAVADSLIRTMSVEERVGRLLIPAIYASADSTTLEYVRQMRDKYHVRGFLLLRGDTASVKVISRMMPPESLIAIDAEWGLAMRLSGTPLFPANGDLSPGTDDQKMFDYGREIARQCRRLGINMVLGPVFDLAPQEISTSMGRKRSFGDDPERAGALGTAYAKGLESGGVISVAKHFPGLGRASADSHLTLPEIAADSATLLNSDILPFRQYIQAGLGCIMVGHVWAPALDTVRRSATVSPVIMKDLLRGHLGFKGVVITDALNMAGYSGDDALSALQAGADLILAPTDVARSHAQITAAVKDGRLPEATLNRALYHVLLLH